VIRFAIVAYLSAATAFGPAVCCCNLRQFSSRFANSQCCGAWSSHRDGKHFQCRYCKPSSSFDASLPKRRNDAPCPGSDRCPCRRQRSNLASAPDPASPTGLPQASVEWPMPIDCQASSTNTGLGNRRLQRGDDERPALLFGRGILRAYQMLRC
jgi:hypothetical protein